ncbi:HlyC/CorC family transporter [Pseudothauera nasutitermitis]|uniref:HlyC/CorC family transporter n=1 Tax=Pseudothauera nasutitermitis TaxID=2565930 RepID=A0A4S4B3X1_9RHOO|nr:hemolysin family protein [Pseudothauera nasutitermitis]THF67387.1 HlyC/CorC family transporter [Pseudothauera nasutitermitis]
MEILILVILILLNGLFAMSEIALVTARRARLARQAEEGDSAAAVAVKLGEDPTRFLSTIQIGITSIGILSGIFGEAALAGPLAEWLQTLGAAQRPSEIGATVLVVVVITYVSIVIGELVPKRLGQINPEGIARLVARPMNMLAVASRPFVHLLSVSTSVLLRLLGQRETQAPSVTEEEIRALLAEGSEAGIIEKSEHEMVRNVFRLDERQIASLMVPRSDIVWLDVNRPLEENLTLVAETDHSRFPVCRGGPDDILGVIGAKQLFNQTVRGMAMNLEQDLQPPVYVPESLTGMELLDQFRASGTHMVFVIDEYGEIQGIVTLHDLIESVTGEFVPSDTEEGWAVQREDGSWLLDGLIPIVEMKDRLGLHTVPEEEKGRYHTLSGMMMWLLGRLPGTGDVATWEGWRLEVVDLDGKRIDKVLASRLPEPEGDTPIQGEAAAPGDN